MPTLEESQAAVERIRKKIHFEQKVWPIIKKITIISLLACACILIISKIIKKYK